MTKMTRPEMLDPSLRNPKVQKWLGLVAMTLAVLISVSSGALAFQHLLTPATVFTIMGLCLVVLFIPGFILHIMEIVRRRRENRG